MTPDRNADRGPAGEDESQSDRDDGFVMLVINHQHRLYAYILSLVLDRERASDILQQTNLVLLEKQAGFEQGTDFFAWSARVAYYEVLADRRRRSRDKHLFSDELLAVVASESSAAVSLTEERTDALRKCLAKLSPANRDLLMQRYRTGGSVAAIAESLGKTPGAVSAVLHRLRVSLMECVGRQMRQASNT